MTSTLKTLEICKFFRFFHKIYSTTPYDTQNKKRLCWNKKSEKIEEEPLGDLRITDFLLVAEQIVRDPDDLEKHKQEAKDRLNLTRKIWEYRRVLTVVKTDGQETIQSLASNIANCPRLLNNSQISRGIDCTDPETGKTIRVCYNDTEKTIQFGNKAPEDVSRYSDFFKYLGGGWFEEYVYDKVGKIGGIKESLINVRFVSPVDSKDNDMHEVDVLATDGNRLYVIECKAGKFVKNDVSSLNTWANTYGGRYALGVMVARHNQGVDISGQEICSLITNDLNNVCMFSGDNLSKFLSENLINAKPKDIYQ